MSEFLLGENYLSGLVILLNGHFSKSRVVTFFYELKVLVSSPRLVVIFIRKFFCGFAYHFKSLYNFLSDYLTISARSRRMIPFPNKKPET
jgi:hypothetical protein